MSDHAAGGDVVRLLVEEIERLLRAAPLPPNELDRAFADVMIHGYGFLKLTAEGHVKHVPYSEWHK